jgi:hypothetical protein
MGLYSTACHSQTGANTTGVAVHPLSASRGVTTCTMETQSCKSCVAQMINTCAVSGPLDPSSVVQEPEAHNLYVPVYQAVLVSHYVLQRLGHGHRTVRIAEFWSANVEVPCQGNNPFAIVAECSIRQLLLRSGPT